MGIEIAFIDNIQIFESKNYDMIDSKIDELNNAWQVASQEMYNSQSNNEQPQNESGGETNETENVDYEEVK